MVQRLFGIQAVTRLRCEQTEETSTERNTAYALKCNIAIDTNLLDQGIRLGLKDDREKTSAVTNQMALFQVSRACPGAPSTCGAALGRAQQHGSAGTQQSLSAASPGVLAASDATWPNCA